MTTARTFLLGTRGSLLATTQSGHVRDGVLKQGFSCELHIVHTPGDASQAAQTPVTQIGVGVFTETLRTALAQKECDIAVHSFKDLPTAPDNRFTTIVPPRADAREVLVSRGNRTLLELPKGAKVGTGAPRRVAQILAVRPDLELVPIRGNITTRMGRINEDLDAVVLARAGLSRAGLLEHAAESIDPSLIMPAPAQGALSVEVRSDDEEAWAAVEPLDHTPSHAQAIAERAVLATLEAGCSAPVAAYSTIDAAEDGTSATITVHGGAYALDGSESLVRSTTVTIALGPTGTLKDRTWQETELRAREAGSTVGRALLDAGAERLMAAEK
ncbi:hydroxymethylbilane synthase [Corynebacterium sp. 4HC-13]|uniref:hydroxymethylbilane synthase n=1 Tax=Corynebacterium anserum TaxID=2684406 RepID=UPI0016399DFC|nr:hydroxymethylbilane synthase [Corynebacterium anserum]MBC2682311.1 hydroxymethylbilane synthase [Corynebacterium anserum]